MILEANGKAFELNLAELTVALRLPISNKNVSASTSSTDTINTGTKAKILTISGTLPFKRDKHLEQLVQIAEAESNSGERQLYSIIDDTAKAANIRQVIFDGDFNVRKIKELNAWNVSFSLQQKNSVAEAKEARANNSQTNQPAATDSANGTAFDAEGTTELIKESHSMIYKMLKKLDAFLEPDHENT